ncbi:dihydrodipicolinate synthetase family protein, partial [Vibrio parahaemolyticus V-223/04]
SFTTSSMIVLPCSAVLMILRLSR